MTFNLPVLADIANPTLTQTLQHTLDQKTKPLGSLGQHGEVESHGVF